MRILQLKALPRRKDPYRRALTEEERNKLLAVSGKRRIVYLFAMYTGLRREEMKRLRWDDIIFEEGKNYLAVRASTTKNGKSVQIPLTDQLEQALLAIKKRLKRRKETVFNKIIPEVCTLRKSTNSIHRCIG